MQLVRNGPPVAGEEKVWLPDKNGIGGGTEANARTTLVTISNMGGGLSNGDDDETTTPSKSHGTMEFHIKINDSYCDSGMDEEHFPPHLNNGHEAKCHAYELDNVKDGGGLDSFEMTTQPLISLAEREQNAYKDRCSGNSSRYASTTSTLADERL